MYWGPTARHLQNAGACIADEYVSVLPGGVCPDQPREIAGDQAPVGSPIEVADEHALDQYRAGGWRRTAFTGQNEKIGDCFLLDGGKGLPIGGKSQRGVAIRVERDGTNLPIGEGEEADLAAHEVRAL